MVKSKTLIYLIRHGEAMGNVEEFFQGRIDAEISPKGKLQLDRLAERFRAISYDVIISSPLKRAFATAEAVNIYHGLDIITEPDIIELNGGKWEGVKWSKLPELYPAEYEKWNYRINEFSAPNGESTAQVYDRMAAAIDRIAAEHVGKTVAVVSHGMAIKAYLNYADGRAWENYADPGWSDNTAVSLIEYDEAFKPHILFKNDSSHLDGELSTLAFSKWNKVPEKGGE